MGTSLGFKEDVVNFMLQGGKLFSSVFFFPKMVMSIMKDQETMDMSCVFLFSMGVGL
jgi:hypothetical protein